MDENINKIRFYTTTRTRRRRNRHQLIPTTTKTRIIHENNKQSTESRHTKHSLDNIPREDEQLAIDGIDDISQIQQKFAPNQNNRGWAIQRCLIAAEEWPAIRNDAPGRLPTIMRTMQNSTRFE